MSNVVGISGSDYPLVALKADRKVAASAVTAPPASLSNVVAVAAGRYHALALRSDGTVTNWAFGSPVTPVGLSNVVFIGSGPNHCLAILGNGPAPAAIPYANLKWRSNVFTLFLPATEYGRLYWLESKDSLTASAWKTLPLTPAYASSLTVTDSVATVPQRFYRIRKW